MGLGELSCEHPVGRARSSVGKDLKDQAQLRARVERAGLVEFLQQGQQGTILALAGFLVPAHRAHLHLAQLNRVSPHSLRYRIYQPGLFTRLPNFFSD